MARRTGVVLGMLFLAHAGAAQFVQQGGKLVGAGAVGNAAQGGSVAISADGSTAIIGGSADDSSTGAAWVYTRSGGVWSQQGGKLLASGGASWPGQGASVAISSDGNTVIVGGPGDNAGIGAAWVYTRSGGVWSQQGNKLTGADAVNSYHHDANQGRSVAISGAGNTAIVGGPWDNSGAGAAWVFTRTAGMWSQQGTKLVGTGAVGDAAQGYSVAISGDGNTALVGGPEVNGSAWGFPQYGAGAAWVYTRSGGIWSQQGSKLLGTGAVGNAGQGFSVAISADGVTALVGGPHDNSGIGAAWGFASTGCASPSIASQPQSQSIASGQTAMLSVAATGAEPFSYRWYQGNAGDTSTPVGADASTFTTPPLESTTSYWVWVLNACGTADSATATISVERPIRRHLRRAM